MTHYYDPKELLSVLGDNFHIIQKTVCKENFHDETVVKTKKFFITNKNNISEIMEICENQRHIEITFSDGSQSMLHEDVSNFLNRGLFTINRNDYFSPSFEKRNGFIASNENLDKWLAFNGLI